MSNKRMTEIEKILNLPDPMLQFKWVAKYLPFDLPPEYMENIDLPFNNLSVSEGVFVGGKFLYYPGTHTISSFNISVYEDRNGRALAWINRWKSRVKNFETGAYFLPGNYKRNIIVSQLDQKNNPVTTIKLKGCWPSDTAPMQLNYTDGSARIIHQQTFSVDDQEIQLHRTSL